jgi:hypothetical protein
VRQHVVAHLVAEDEERLGIVAFAIVVSQTTTRLDAPRPVTYAFTPVYFVLAFITNIFSGAMCSPRER